MPSPSAPSPVPATPANAAPARKLSLAHLSLIACDAPTLVRIAGKAGFDCVDLRLAPATPTDRVYTAAERFTLCRELLPRLRDGGTEVWDVEIVRLDGQTNPTAHQPLIEAAAMLGARRIKVVSDIGDEGRVAEALAGLCRLSAPLGLTVDLEYMVFSGVRSLAQALRVVRAAAQPNLCVLVDALHWMRAADTLEALRAAAPGSLGYLQLCDGPRVAPSGNDPLRVEARTRRLAPGAGEFPLTGLVQAMPADCLLSIEVPMPDGADPSNHAHSLAQSTRRLLRAAQPGVNP